MNGSMIVEYPPFIFTMMTGFQASLACVLYISCLSLSLSLPHSLSTIPATILPLSVPLSSLSLCHYPPSLCATTLPPSPPSSSLSTMLMPNIVNSSARSEEHTSELQSRPHISYAVFCLKKKITTNNPI